MKKILLLILIMLSLVLCQAKGLNFESEFDFDLSYDNNILNLSEADQDQFENNDKPEKYQIESLDDLIMGFRYKLKAKHYWLGGHTQVLDVGIAYKKYLTNEVRDNITISTGVEQYFSSKLSANILYSYTPEIYLRQYHSVLDDEYHEFVYAKNGLRAELVWKMFSKLSLKYRFEYSQLYYNEWFTEYDTGVLTNNLYLNWNITKRLSTEFRYGRRSSDADADAAFSNPAEIEVIKDASYEGNIYSINLKCRKFISNFTLNLGYSLNEKFFDSEFEKDIYHEERDDYTHAASASVLIPLAKGLKMVVHANYEERDTRSPYASVINDKEYKTWKSGISFSYDINHK